MAPKGGGRGGGGSSRSGGLQSEPRIDITYLYGHYDHDWELVGETAVAGIALIFTLVLLVLSKKYASPNHSPKRTAWFKWLKFAFLLLFIVFALTTARCVVQKLKQPVFLSFHVERPIRTFFTNISVLILIVSAYYLLWRSQKNSDSSSTYFGLQKWPNAVVLTVLGIMITTEFGFAMYDAVTTIIDTSPYAISNLSHEINLARTKLSAAQNLLVWLVVLYYQIYAIVLHTFSETRQLNKTLLTYLTFLAIPGLTLLATYHTYFQINFTLHNLGKSPLDDGYHDVQTLHLVIETLVLALGAGTSCLGFLLIQRKTSWDHRNSAAAPAPVFVDDQPPSMYEQPKGGFEHTAPPHVYYAPPPPAHDAYSPPPTHPYSSPATSPDPYRMSAPVGGYVPPPPPPLHHSWQGGDTQWRQQPQYPGPGVAH